MKEGRVVANGIEFAFLEEGSGPLLLLLHGYPDIAWTWEHQMAPFAAAGRGHGSTARSACRLWRCAAPTTSGPNR